MHNAAIAHLGLDYVYLPLPVKPENLAAAIAGFAAIGLRGFSITIPHKQAILPLLSEVSAIAQAVGAVNTVWRTNAGWSGTNTDVEGFLAPLKAQNRDWSQTTVVILGNGGAARAVVVGCGQLGCARMQAVGRSQQKLETFAQSWAGASLPLNLTVHAWETLPDLLPDADLVVNTTPIGMHPQVEASPLSPQMAEKLSNRAIAYDLIYTPSPTRFLRQAQVQGATTIDGLEMLVQQGVAALTLWLQLDTPAATIPVDIMRHALKQQLGLPT